MRQSSSLGNVLIPAMPCALVPPQQGDHQRIGQEQNHQQWRQIKAPRRRNYLHVRNVTHFVASLSGGASHPPIEFNIFPHIDGLIVSAQREKRLTPTELG